MNFFLSLLQESCQTVQDEIYSTPRAEEYIDSALGNQQPDHQQDLRLDQQIAQMPAFIDGTSAAAPRGLDALFSESEESESEEEEDGEVTEVTRPLGNSTILRVGGPVHEEAVTEAQRSDSGKGEPSKRLTLQQYQQRQAERPPVTIPLGAPAAGSADPRLARERQDTRPPVCIPLGPPADPRLARPYTIPRRKENAPPSTAGV